MSNLLIFTAAQFNVVRNLTDMQIMLLANELPARYWHWRMDEFAYVLKEAVAGRWGKVYDRLDPATVHEWCAAYDVERQELIAAEAESEVGRLRAAERDKAAPTNINLAYLQARMDALSTEELEAGLAYYHANPDKPDAAIKCELAVQLLQERAATSAEVLKPASAAVVVTPAAVPGLYDNLPETLPWPGLPE